MARPQIFDRADVIKRITETFWLKGYSATSIVDLLDATKLGRQSLYNSFGNKEQLFLLAFDAYTHDLFERYELTLAQATRATAGFKALFDSIVASSVADDLRRGCMLVNTASELATHSDAIRERVLDVERSIEALFTAVIERGQASAEIPKNKNPRKLAIHLHNSIIGIRVRARYAPSRITLQAIADESLQALR